jgi:predicted flap endonuclease-1-like 5' DNA nuclease
MWLWPVSILVIVILFVWWALTRQAQYTETPSHHEHHNDVQEHLNQHETHEVNVRTDLAPEAVSFVEPKDDLPEKEDDLTIIEGIGPKISSVLKAAGIKTFTRLASTNVDALVDILTKSDPRLGRIAEPSSWPEQSRLAAEGKLEELKALQDNLKGGRAS